MYILVHKNKPVTWKQFYKILDKGYVADDRDENMFLVGRTKRAVIENFIYVGGFKWSEWQKDGWDIVPFGKKADSKAKGLLLRARHRLLQYNVIGEESPSLQLINQAINFL